MNNSFYEWEVQDALSDARLAHREWEGRYYDGVPGAYETMKALDRLIKALETVADMGACLHADNII